MKSNLPAQRSAQSCIITSVIRRLYVHNFRCLENFELPVSGLSSVLLIGKNGAGKTTVGFALEILQRIARGTNRVGDLVKPIEAIQRIIAHGQETGEFRADFDARLAGIVFYGGVEELLSGWVLGQLPDGDDMVAAAERTLVDVVCGGFLAGGEQLSEARDADVPA